MFWASPQTEAEETLFLSLQKTQNLLVASGSVHFMTMTKYHLDAFFSFSPLVTEMDNCLRLVH